MKGEALELPPGFRFHPTDEELVNYYLTAKCAGMPISAPIIAEIDLYKFDPWQLPEMALYGEKEWYFFSPRDRKYPNGSRPNRAAGSGYWKATGADKPIGSLGIKKALVFYAGKAPKGIKTNWIMHEYRPAKVYRSAPRKNNLRLDDWVLCRLYNKKGRIEKHYPIDKKEIITQSPQMTEEDQKPDVKLSGHQKITTWVPQTSTTNNEQSHMDTSESAPWLQPESSCSEQMLSPEEWQKPNWTIYDALDEFQFNNVDGNRDDDLFAPQFQYQMDQLSPLQGMFLPLQEPYF